MLKKHAEDAFVHAGRRGHKETDGSQYKRTSTATEEIVNHKAAAMVVAITFQLGQSLADV